MKAQGKTKNCPHCAKLGLGPQPLSAFGKNARRDDGHQDQCRVAAAELYQKRTYGENGKQRRSEDLQSILNRLSTPRYDNLIQMILEIAQARYKTTEKAAKWLGMKPGTFQVLLVKFKVTGSAKKQCKHEIVKETCVWCR